MNYIRLKSTLSAVQDLETEIMFSIASARAQKIDFVQLELSDDNEQKIKVNAVKLLKLLKKQGRIQLFIDSDELRGSSTEAQYLANKYPDAYDAFNNGEKAIIIKI